MTTTDYRLIDSTLRDGSHALSHQYQEADVIKIVQGLDAAGVQVIEIAHGDGLGGSSFNYGFSAVRSAAAVMMSRLPAYFGR